jgi:hypothetical protein
MQFLSFKTFPVIIATATPILIFLGIFSTGLYYQAFGINVIDYIELDEAILLFFRYVFYIILIAAFAISVPVIINKNSENILKDRALRPINSKEKKILLFFAVLLFAAFLPTKIPNVGEIWFFILTSIKVIFLLLCCALIYPFSVFSPKRSIMLSIFFFTYAVILLFSSLDVNAQYKSSYKKTILFSDKTVLTTDSDTIYIGKTRNYYFFYLKRSKGNYIVDAKNISTVSNAK